MDNNIIGRQISTLRHSRQMTQEELAMKIGVSTQSVSNWETGLKTPRMGAIQKIADLFNVSKSFIIEGNSDELNPLLSNSAGESSKLVSIYDKLNSENKIKLVNIGEKLLEKQLAEDTRKAKEEKLNLLMDEVISKHGVEALRTLQKIVEADDISELPDSNSK